MIYDERERCSKEKGGGRGGVGEGRATKMIGVGVGVGVVRATRDGIRGKLSDKGRKRRR